MIQPGPSFKDNLAQLPPIAGVARVDLIDANDAVVASIEDRPGQQGSLAVYLYLKQSFGQLAPEAAEHGLAVFAEHTPGAGNRPGAHPNIDRLIDIAAGAGPLRIEIVAA